MRWLSAAALATTISGCCVFSERHAQRMGEEYCSIGPCGRYSLVGSRTGYVYVRRFGFPTHEHGSGCGCPRRRWNDTTAFFMNGQWEVEQNGAWVPVPELPPPEGMPPPRPPAKHPNALEESAPDPP